MTPTDYKPLAAKMVGALAFATVSLNAGAASPRPPVVEIEACRIELAGRSLSAEGAVSLRRNACTLRAAFLRLTPQGLFAKYATLRAKDGALFFADQVRIVRGKGELQWIEAGLFPCGANPIVKLRASRASLSRARVHLRWPVVSIGRLPVLALPYLALPRHPGVSGLLSPEVAYSGRDGFRLGQAVYGALGQLADAEGSVHFVEGRGWGLGLRGRAFSDGRLVGDILTRWQGDGARWLVASEGSINYSGPGWLVEFAPQIVSHADVSAVLQRSAARILAPISQTRFRAAIWRGIVVARLEGDWLQALDAASEGRPERALAGSVAVQLIPTALLGGLTPVGGLILDGASRPVWIGEEGLLLPWRGSDRPLWGWRADPGLEIARRVGPLRTLLAGRYVLRGTRVGDDGRSHRQQIAILGGEVALPISRAWGARWTHQLELGAGGYFGAATGRAGELVGGWWGLRERRLGVVAARTSLWDQRRSEPAFSAAARLVYGDDLLTLFDVQLRMATLLHLETKGSAAPDKGAVPLLDARVCLGGAKTRLCGSYLRQRVDAQWHRGIGEALNFGALTNAGLPWALSIDGVGASLRQRLGWGEWGAYLVADAAREEISALGATLSVGRVCGALGVGLRIDYRAGQTWPDVTATLALHDAGWSRCF